MERDLRAYLRCGILAHGFARVRCEDCGHERLLACSHAPAGACVRHAIRGPPSHTGMVSGNSMSGSFTFVADFFEPGTLITYTGTWTATR